MTNVLFYRKVLRLLGVTEEQLAHPNHRLAYAEARYLMAAALMELPQTRQGDVAKVLHTRQSTVSRSLKRHKTLLEVDATYRAKWEEIVGLLNKK